MSRTAGLVRNYDPEMLSGSRLRMNTANHATQNTLLGGPLGGPPFFVPHSPAPESPAPRSSTTGPNGRAVDSTFFPTETESVHR